MRFVALGEVIRDQAGYQVARRARLAGDPSGVWEMPHAQGVSGGAAGTGPRVARGAAEATTPETTCARDTSETREAPPPRRARRATWCVCAVGMTTRIATRRQHTSASGDLSGVGANRLIRAKRKNVGATNREWQPRSSFTHDAPPRRAHRRPSVLLRGARPRQRWGRRPS